MASYVSRVMVPPQAALWRALKTVPPGRADDGTLKARAGDRRERIEKARTGAATVALAGKGSCRCRGVARPPPAFA
ncbi:MAG TPA: hypothetical protein VGE74_09100 [Gemmata sp.]